KMAALETSQPASMTVYSFVEFKIIVFVMGLKKFTKSVRRMDTPIIPTRIKAQFFKFLSGFLVIARLAISNISGIKKTGPILIMYSTTLPVTDMKLFLSF
ncbi:MAG: hypothetical protein PHN81_05290, partial [Actinomycetota bacterium]|nr:hypothetical protein [Actinomycetota bacterium]